MSQQASRHVHHYHRHMSVSYPVSLIQRLYTILLIPLLTVLVCYLVARYLSVRLPTDTISFNQLVLALLYTIERLGIAYILAVIVAIPLAILATATPLLESLFLPMFDILQSVPFLAFFPVVILVFISFNDLNGAAVFILFLAMLWNIVFTLIGGINVIPKDIDAARRVFGIRGWRYYFQILLPSLVPQLVTGSILAIAQGWNIIIVAEVLHTYIPHGTAAQDLFGIGSVLVNAAANGQTNVFLLAVAAMTIAIAILNFFVWQKLLHYAQRFRFE
jgi:ABC-type anion transport system duplicated permease subunit